MQCFVCQTENRESAITCVKCGASLRSARAQLYLDRAEADVNTGRFEQANKNMAKADSEMLMVSSEERERHRLTARAFWLQGNIYFFKGMMPEAKEEFQLAEQNMTAANGGPLLALVLNRLAHVSNYEGRFDDAIDYLRQSIAQATLANDHATAAKATANLGNVYSEQGKGKEAAELYAQALVHAEASGEPAARAPMYRLLADHYAAFGPFSQALEYADKGLALANQLDDLYIRALSLADAANIYMRYGDVDKAVYYLHDAYELTHRTGNKLATEAVMLNIAELMRFDEYTEHQQPWVEGALEDFSETLISTLSKGPYALQMAYYYIRQQDWGHLNRLSYQLKQINTTTMMPIEILQMNAARAMIHAALGEWEQAAAQFALAANSDKLSPYERAVINEDYARMLLNRARVKHDPEVEAQVNTALKEAASLYREMGLPQRAGKIESLLSLSLAAPSC